MSMAVQIKVEPGLGKLVVRLGSDIQGGIAAALQHVVSEIEAHAVGEAPVKTSDLVNSITSYVQGLTGVIKATAGHAEYVHEGTKAHMIFPKNGKALFWPGANHPVKWVLHPGTRPNKFFKRAIKKTDPQKSFETGLQNYLNRRGW